MLPLLADFSAFEAVHQLALMVLEGGVLAAAAIIILQIRSGGK